MFFNVGILSYFLVLCPFLSCPFWLVTGKEGQKGTIETPKFLNLPGWFQNFGNSKICQYVKVKNLCWADSENFSQNYRKLIELLIFLVMLVWSNSRTEILCQSWYIIFWRLFGHKTHLLRFIELKINCKEYTTLWYLLNKRCLVWKY